MEAAVSGGDHLLQKPEEQVGLVLDALQHDTDHALHLLRPEAVAVADGLQQAVGVLGLDAQFGHFGPQQNVPQIRHPLETRRVHVQLALTHHFEQRLHDLLFLVFVQVVYETAQVLL